MRALLLIAFLAGGAWAAEEHEEGGGARTGQGKAILEASAERGMKISDKALKRLGVKTVLLYGVGSFRLPAHALIHSEEEIGVYRLREGWYKHVEVELLSKEKNFVVVRAKDLRAGDHVVVTSAPLLRVAELDVLGGEEAGHDH